MKLTATNLIVGIDGGGTGCRVAICDATGQSLSEGQGGPANYTTDPHTTLRNICDALNSAASGAGLKEDWRGNCVAHVGLAGIMNSADAKAVASALQLRQITVTDDRETSVAGALQGEDGIVAAIGTGTIVAFSFGGASRFIGGWGHELADQASGGWLGHDALRLAMLAHDSCIPHSDLTKDLLNHFNNSPLDIVHFARRAEPGDYATFAPKVVEAARNKDANAEKLMAKGATYLNTCIRAAETRDDSPICLAGGVGPHYKSYLHNAFQPRVRPPLGTALDGALFLARQKAKKMEAEP